ncbi:AfsA-related hotdog domain-containing protein [Mycolicibacterium cosmeticum]|uniref:AfsA-related hotdog domain-containing protein n=1 Tax=Mycolicibacterium cosmeticum TaxID=258533 RepID=UPI003204A7F2
MNASTHSRTIDRELVHKRAVSEVLVTSVTGAAESTDPWLCHAQLPRRHSFHTDMTGAQGQYHDPLLVMEAFRQACIAASHLFYDVALDARHTVRYYELTVVDPAALRRGRQTLDLEFTIMVRREFRRGQDGPVQGLDVAGVATHEGTKLMELSGAFGWMSAAKWTALRAGASWDPGPQITPAHPDRVGRSCRENVVIGEPAPHADGACAPVVVDIAHPTIFDHPLDHLPGGLIIEAGRQLAMTLLGSRAAAVTGPARMRCDFQSFTELDAPSTVTMAPAGEDALTFRGAVTQSGQTRATVELTFAADDHI